MTQAAAVQRTIEIGFKPQPGPQVAFIACPCDIVVYGGARGGGKSYASLGEFWLHAEQWGPDAKGLMCRKTREDLKDTIEIASQMYGTAAKYDPQNKWFRFQNGAVLHMAYLETDADAQNYQGWSLTRVYVEELTQYPESRGIFKLFATLRSKKGIRCQWRATCNPGGPGHHWVKQWVIDIGPLKPTLDPETNLTRVFIPAKLSDNPALLHNDPTYVNRLRASGSPELVRAWLEGDWDIVEGAFFPEFSKARHVIAPFKVPREWTRFRSLDWGSARPFSVGWWAVAQDPVVTDDRHFIPRNALVRYREWYGASAPNQGLKLTAEIVAAGIRQRQEPHEEIAYGIADPSTFAVISGPSIAETFGKGGVHFRRADNTRVSVPKRFGGWDQLRARLRGDGDGDGIGDPMIFFFSTCHAIIRTLPMMQHSEINPEDLDTDGEDHAVDEVRYACMSRPYIQPVLNTQRDSVWNVANAFKLHELD